jgi:DNA-binding IclR family transcriptional regulator
VGTRAPLHCTGLGKAILSKLDADEALGIVARHGLTRFTPHTICDRGQLARELERIRADGYTIDLEENELGVVCVAAAMPVRADRPVAALSVSGPSSRLAGEDLRNCSRLVLETARVVERALG